MRSLARLVFLLLTLSAGACTCHSSWLGNCQESTPLDYCLAACPHPNVVVACAIDQTREYLPCADCCIARYGRVDTQKKGTE